MRYTIAAAALALVACSEPPYAKGPGLYVVGYAYGHLPAEGDMPAQEYDGDVVVVAGPVPYGEAECWQRALDMNAEMAQEGADFEMRVRCELHRKRPEIPGGTTLEG